MRLALALLLGMASVSHCQLPHVGCGDGLWAHVYHPDRLVLHADCIAVRGTIVDATHGKRRDGLRHEADGDTHGWLALDAGQDSLLNAGNVSDEGGNLVFEVVCAYTVKQADAKASCARFPSAVVIPPVGSHVEMTGSWVMDTRHARWQEIHPVSSIRVLTAADSGSPARAPCVCPCTCRAP